MVFEEWWYKHGVELGIEKNDACTVWVAAQQTNNSAMPKLPYDLVENFINVEYMDASINDRARILRIASELYTYITGQLRQ